MYSRGKEMVNLATKTMKSKRERNSTTNDSGKHFQNNLNYSVSMNFSPIRWIDPLIPDYYLNHNIKSKGINLNKAYLLKLYPWKVNQK